MRVALKVDVDTLRGTLEGVPALVRLLRRHSAGATFLFSLGPDHTGRALKRIFRPGFLAKVLRTSVGANYGPRTLLYGTLLPGPDIGRRAAGAMRAVAQAGFETGIHTWDHVRWQDYVTRRGEAWTRHELERAAARFKEVFGQPARSHGAAGWQINRYALACEEALGFDYCSDTRGSTPFLPAMEGRVYHCPQIPTTLPTLDELIGREGLTEANVAARVLALSETAPAHGHVYTLHAELEGMRLLPVFETLLRGWAERGYALTPMRDVRRELSPDALPVHEVRLGTLPGRSGVLALQGPARQSVSN